MDRKEKKNNRTKSLILLVSVLAILVVIGGTVAFLTTRTEAIENKFLPGEASVEVTEKFDGTVKRNVNVTNTGNINVYIRVRLVTYRVDTSGNIIGGTATIPDFTPGDGWVKSGDYYYYTSPVAPGGQPATNLIDRITLTNYYNDSSDPDGGYQVIEVIAEGIQSDGTDSDGNKAVKIAWGLDPELL